MVDVLRALEIEFIALTPGASFRGLHDSLVNHAGNERPTLLLCIHEESAVALAHGYARVDRQAAGGGAAQQCRADACHDGDLQRLVRPGADPDAGRGRPGGCDAAAALGGLDPYRQRSRRADPRLHQVGRPAGFGAGGARGDRARPPDRRHPAEGSRPMFAWTRPCRRSGWRRRRPPFRWSDSARRRRRNRGSRWCRPRPPRCRRRSGHC